MAPINIREAKIALVNKTTEEWNLETKIPIKGCPCVEWTADGNVKLKIGDGNHLFPELLYIANESTGGSSENLTYAQLISILGYTPADNDDVGVAGGIASLDSDGKVPNSQLPDYINIIEVDNINNAPTIGKSGKIYVAVDTGKCYRWTGIQYTEISKSLIITASEKNGYIKINDIDVRVYAPIQSDWNEEDETSSAFIKNKPNIPDGVVVDGELSDTSTNAIQNKIVKNALDNKLNLNDTIILNCVI